MPSIVHIAALSTMAVSVLADIHQVSMPSAANGGPFFQGPQSGVGSWYRASANQDSTNGKSWCGYTYYNSDPLFAVVRRNSTTR